MCLSMEDQSYKAKSLALSLQSARKPIDDNDFIIYVMRGLGFEFDLNIAAINACDVCD